MSKLMQIIRRGWAAVGCWMALAGGLAAEPAAAVKVGVLTDNYPFSFRDEHGAEQGFVYDLAAEIERVMGLRFERIVGTTEEINGAFRAGRLDLLQSYARFPEREAEADFSVPYLTMAGAIFARPGLEGVRALEDLRGRKVLVHRGSMGETLLRRAGLGESVVYVTSVEQALIDVDAGRGDATLVTRLSGLAAAHHLGLRRLRALDAPVKNYEVRYCFAVRDGDRELLAQINEGLAITVQTGTYDRIYRKWFGQVEPTHYSVLQITLAVAVGLAIALLVALWAVVRQKRLQHRIEGQAEVLRLSEDRLRTVFDGEQDGLLVLGPGAGDGGCAVEQINPAARRLTAGELGSEERRTLRAWLVAEPTLAKKIEEAAARREAAEFEHPLSDGQRCWRIAVSPLGAGALVRVSDITETAKQRQRQARQDAQLQHAQKLEAIGTLAGGVAHDFNNLLTVIMGHADLCLMELPPRSTEAENLRKIMEASRRARQLVRQVLTFSKRAEPTRERLAVGPVVEEMLSFLRTLGRNSVEFEHRRGEALPEIVADSAQLHQVLMNVATNAVQAMRAKGGRLTVVEECVTVGDEVRAQHPQIAAGRYVRIGIQDTGPGMSAEVQARIFEPYFTTKPAGEGTGLGLSVVHGIMQLHGGAVTVYSQVGRGTVFHLYFPIASGEVPAATVAAAEMPRGKGERVLLVDDDAGVGRTAQLVLERLGYRVSRHLSPVEALAEFETGGAGFALLFTDLAMPEMTGLELARRVRGLRPALPIVVMSGFFSRAEEEALLALGVAQRLHKPLTIVAMSQAVAAALRPERGAAVG